MIRNSEKQAIERFPVDNSILNEMRDCTRAANANSTASA
jgi:hypothetical protein